MIFIDQPVGVGFSYAEYGETVVSNKLSVSVSCTHHNPTEYDV